MGLISRGESCWNPTNPTSQPFFSLFKVYGWNKYNFVRIHIDLQRILEMIAPLFDHNPNQAWEYSAFCSYGVSPHVVLRKMNASSTFLSKCQVGQGSQSTDLAFATSGSIHWRHHAKYLETHYGPEVVDVGIRNIPETKLLYNGEKIQAFKKKYQTKFCLLNKGSKEAVRKDGVFLGCFF